MPQVGAYEVRVDDKLSRFTGSDDVEKFQQTQYKIMQSWSLAQRVFQALNLGVEPALDQGAWAR